MTVPVRPLRKDAAANRERILDAAAGVFHEQGPAAGLEDIARRAGVGVATVYRRFASREELVEALLQDLLTTWVEVATRAMTEPAGGGLARFMTEIGDVQAEPRGCAIRMWGSPAVEALRTRVDALIQELLDDAQQHGTCRPDVTVADLVGILVALRGIREAAAKDGMDWRRHLALCLRGLR